MLNVLRRFLVAWRTLRVTVIPYTSSKSSCCLRFDFRQFWLSLKIRLRILKGLNSTADIFNFAYCLCATARLFQTLLVLLMGRWQKNGKRPSSQGSKFLAMITSIMVGFVISFVPTAHCPVCGNLHDGCLLQESGWIQPSVNSRLGFTWPPAVTLPSKLDNGFGTCSMKIKTKTKEMLKRAQCKINSIMSRNCTAVNNGFSGQDDIWIDAGRSKYCSDVYVCYFVHECAFYLQRKSVLGSDRVSNDVYQ